MKKVFEKYGLVNVLISSACIMVFLLNSILVSKATLVAINENIAAAYALNFFGDGKGCWANGVACPMLHALKTCNYGECLHISICMQA